MNWDRPVIFDLETDGCTQIIQIGALAPASEERFQVKVRFNEAKADHAALAGNHYDHRIWKREAVPAKEARDLFNAFLYANASVPSYGRWHDRLAIGMGWNTSHFDQPHLQRWYGEGCERLCMDPRTLDVLELAKWCVPGLRSYNLERVARIFNVWRPGAHDAQVDCEMTTDIAALLIRSISVSPPTWVWERFFDNKGRRRI